MRALLLVGLLVAIPFGIWCAWQLLVWVGPSLGGIPQPPAIDPPPRFQGAPTRPRPVRAEPVPQHPFMGPNGAAVLHVDAYMSDAHEAPGPLGHDIEATSRFLVGECGTVTFDRAGRIITVCIRPRQRFLALLDPESLEVLDTYELPPRQGGLLGYAPGMFSDVSGGGYFYLDHRDRAVVPTTTRRVWTVEVDEEGEFRRVDEIDLRSAIEEGDALQSVLPDWQGRLWFVSRDGVVGFVSREERAPLATGVGEGIDNSFAVDETGGVFVVSDRALYRFEAGARGPRQVWREPYANTGERKPGQFAAGSGTTPTLLGRRWVAITDNADPMAVVVYRRDAGFRGEREVCRQRVFEAGASATENTLIGIGRSLVVENNHGYEGPASALLGGTSEPGVARVDIDRDGRGCRIRWESQERSPSVVPKLSLATGLVYVYTKPAGATSEPWYLTAIDFRTGRTLFRIQAGRGLGFNNHYAPITLGTDGAAYVGALGGLIRMEGVE